MCLCTDEWTGRYCDQRKTPKMTKELSKEAIASEELITTSNCSRFLMSFEIDNDKFTKVGYSTTH